MQGIKAGYRPCVGMMLYNASGQLFAGQRIDATAEAWQMPQGGIDAGETPVEAAWREMSEEVGTTAATLMAETVDWLYYDLPEDLQPKLWGGQYLGQAQRWFLMRFDGTDDAINIATHHPEFRAWKWVEAEELPQLIVPFKRAVYQQVMDEFLPRIPRRTV